MEHIWVRKAEKRDAAQIGQWLENQSFVDRNVFFYPQTTVLAAHNSQPLIYMPLQLVAMLESLAINPQATRLEIAAAIAELARVSVFMARERGVKEIYFLATNDDTAAYAKRNHFEELPHKVYRLKIDDLELPQSGSPNNAVSSAL